MKTFFLILLFLASGSYYLNKEAEASPPYMNIEKTYSYLALGDSYTIGESIVATDNFPSQVARLLRKDTIWLELIEIIATTGWTTDELEAAITRMQKEVPLRSTYDFVSLLIGVNNQYRGRSLDNYRSEFEGLLKKAIRFAGNNTDHVVVISIPDWGVTPFAKGRDRAAIAGEIDAYNSVNKQLAAQYNVRYIDITPWTREAVNDPALLATDGLHPSAKEYKRWAVRIAEWIKNSL